MFPQPIPIRAGTAPPKRVRGRGHRMGFPLDPTRWAYQSH